MAEAKVFWVGDCFVEKRVKVRKARANPEAAIQRTVVAHLRQRAAGNVYWFAVPNGGFRKIVEAALFKHQGVRAGVPDLILLHRGKLYALELKAENGRPSEAQLENIEMIRNAGGHACICYGLDRALRCLETWGILQRAGA